MAAFYHALVLFLIDLALIAAATLFAVLLRDNFEISLFRTQSLLPYFIATVFAASIVLSGARLNRTIWRFSALRDYLRVVAASIAIVLVAVTLTAFLHRLNAVPRSLPVMQAILIIALLVGARVSMRFRHERRQRREPSSRLQLNSGGEMVLLVGLTPITDLFLRSEMEFAPGRLRIVGILGRHERQKGRQLYQYPVLGTPEEIGLILADLEVHGILIRRILVMISFSDLSREAQHAMLEVAKEQDIRIDFLAERLGLTKSDDTATHPVSASQLFDADMLEEDARRPYFTAKRSIDIVGALALAAVTWPCIAVVAAAVALDVGFPVLFWQQRPGKGGMPFKLYKFRTMRAALDLGGSRIPDTQRLSRFGRFLRRSRLDELPQLYNILIGDMSFVGPRPLLPLDQAPEFVARLLVRPGLTGWAQIAGGRELSAHDKAALDIWYVRNASLATDARIIARTLPTIILGEQPDQRAVDDAWRDLGLLDAPKQQRPFPFNPNVDEKVSLECRF